MQTFIVRDDGTVVIFCSRLKLKRWFVSQLVKPLMFFLTLVASWWALMNYCKGNLFLCLIRQLPAELNQREPDAAYLINVCCLAEWCCITVCWAWFLIMLILYFRMYSLIVTAGLRWGYYPILKKYINLKHSCSRINIEAFVINTKICHAQTMHACNISVCLCLCV